MSIEDDLNDVGAHLADEYAHYDVARQRAKLEELIRQRERSDERQERRGPGVDSEVLARVAAAESPVKNWVEDWTIAAACRGMDADELFVQGAAQNRAKTVCAACPVRTECLADALDNRVEFGVWGGMTERERRTLLRRRPDVRSWRKLLEAKREAYLRRQSTSIGSDPAHEGTSTPSTASQDSGAAPASSKDDSTRPIAADPIVARRAVPEENLEAVERLDRETARLLSSA